MNLQPILAVLTGLSLIVAIVIVIRFNLRVARKKQKEIDEKVAVINTLLEIYRYAYRNTESVDSDSAVQYLTKQGLTSGICHVIKDRLRIRLEPHEIWIQKYVHQSGFWYETPSEIDYKIINEDERKWRLLNSLEIRIRFLELELKATKNE